MYIIYTFSYDIKNLTNNKQEKNMKLLINGGSETSEPIEDIPIPEPEK